MLQLSQCKLSWQEDSFSKLQKKAAKLLGISTNTVVRKIDSLVAKRLIEKEGTTSKCKNGKTRTSNNRYYIMSFEDAWHYAFRFNPSTSIE